MWTTTGAAAMGIYQRHILPFLTDWAMGQSILMEHRSRTVGGASGRVLEIGIGSGRNLPLYGTNVGEVVGVDPSSELLAVARKAATTSRVRVSLIERSAENLPFENASFDTVVVTWSLCSIPDPLAALREARRVLRPGGQLCFVEHGLAPDPGVRRWQHRLTPIWKVCAGGCHLDRKMDDLVRGSGLEIVDLTTGYLPAAKVIAFMYEGRAVRN